MLTKVVFLRILLCGWPSPVLIVNSGILTNERLRRVLLFALCALVFLFVLRAKTGVYNGTAPVKVTPSTASKLWLSAQKLQVPPANSSQTALFWMAVLFLFSIYLKREPRAASAYVPPAPRLLALRHLHRFLRPPPAV